MSDVHFGLALQSLRCVTSGVDRKPLCTTAQKSNTMPVSDANKKIQIQRERLVAKEDPATTPVLISQFDRVRSAADDLAQFLTLKIHLDTPPVSALPIPQGEGRNQNLISDWIV